MIHGHFNSVATVGRQRNVTVDESREASHVLQHFAYSLDENCRMDGFIYKNKIMPIRQRDMSGGRSTGITSWRNMTV